MTREQCIEAMARTIWSRHSGGKWEDALQHRRDQYIALATAAYEALLPHIQAERERVRDECMGVVGALAAVRLQNAKYIEPNRKADEVRHSYAATNLLEARNSIRILDIGGQSDGE